MAPPQIRKQMNPTILCLGTAIRFGANRTAAELAEHSGGIVDKDKVFRHCFPELLAFFSVLALHRASKLISSPDEKALRNLFLRIRESMMSDEVAPEFPEWRIPDSMKLVLKRVVIGPVGSNFDNAFWAYWNGDLARLGITESEVAECNKSGLEPHPLGIVGNRSTAILIRVCRAWKSNKNESLPAVIYLACSQRLNRSFAVMDEALQKILKTK